MVIIHLNDKKRNCLFLVRSVSVVWCMISIAIIWAPIVNTLAAAVVIVVVVVTLLLLLLLLLLLVLVRFDGDACVFFTHSRRCCAVLSFVLRPASFCIYTSMIENSWIGARYSVFACRLVRLWTLCACISLMLRTHRSFFLFIRIHFLSAFSLFIQNLFRSDFSIDFNTLLFSMVCVYVVYVLKTEFDFWYFAEFKLEIRINKCLKFEMWTNNCPIVLDSTPL